MITIANDTTSKASYTKEYIGIVEQVLGATKYQVRYNNTSYEINTKNTLGLKISDTVHVIVPNNNVKNRYILEDLIVSFAKESLGAGGTLVSGVSSVDGLTGTVVLSGIYAKKSNVYTKSEINTMLGELLIPTKMSELTDDVGYVTETELEEKIKELPAAHEHSNKNILDNTTASFTDAEKDKLKRLGSAAYTDSTAYDSNGTAVTAIASHNVTTDAHHDIRLLIEELKTKLNNFLDVDDTTTDQLSEVITLIENNKGTLESLTTSKVNVSDIVNNLTTNVSTKVLSASQGVVIKNLIDALEDAIGNLTYDLSGKIDGDGYVTGIMNDGGDYALTTIGGDVLLATKDDIQDVQNSQDDHINNTNAHVTPNDKIKWNDAVEHANSEHAKVVELTLAEYEALGDVVNHNNVTYYIKDSSGSGGNSGNNENSSANQVSYDNTNSGLEATTVQGAVDELNNAIDGKKIIGNAVLLSFVDGVATLDLSNHFNESLIMTANLVNHTTNALLAGCNAISPDNIKIGVKDAITNQGFTGDVWINYIAIGK